MDISVKLTAAKLGKDLEAVSDRIQSEVENAVKNLANAAYANIVAHVQASQMAQDNKRDYLKSLQFQELGSNTYLISLEGEWPNDLEQGFTGYNLKDKLLSSDKTVKVGSRAGEPWVRTSKKGKKYASVPFEHHPFAGGKGDLATDIKKLVAFNRQGKEQVITKIFKDDLGKPIVGKVATISDKNSPENLQGLTKYQFVHKSGQVSSLYMTFRMVHEDSNGWTHPGWVGHKFFDEVQRDIERELENIINILL